MFSRWADYFNPCCRLWSRLHGPFHGGESRVVAFPARGFLVYRCGELRGGIEEFLSEREEAQSSVVPLGDALEAELVVRAVLDGQAGKKGLERGELGFAEVEAGQQALADEAGNEDFQLELGCVGGGACAGVALDGSQRLQCAKALARGSFADAKARGDVIHRQRLGRGKEYAVDLTVGAGIAEEIGQLGKDLDERVFEVLAGSCLGGLRFMNRRCGEVHRGIAFHEQPKSSIQNEFYF
jgi:hypothetical protein